MDVNRYAGTEQIRGYGDESFRITPGPKEVEASPEALSLQRGGEGINFKAPTAKHACIAFSQIPKCHQRSTTSLRNSL